MARALVLPLALVLLGGCVEPAPTSRVCGGVHLDEPLLVLSSNLQASGLGRLDEEGCLVEIPDIALGADPSLSSGSGGPMVCVRDQGLVHALDPSTLAITRTWVAYDEAEPTFELATGGKAKGPHNPHDADVDAEGRLWVARFEQPTLGVVGADGAFVAKVDLSAFADVDGLPEVEAVRVVGDRVHAALERLDRRTWKPAESGVVVTIDVASREILGSIDLGGLNPFGRMKPAPWDLSGATVGIALPGDFFAIDEGNAAVIVDLSAGVVTGIADESELGGSIAEIALGAPDEAYAIVAGPEIQNPTRLVRLDPTGKTPPRVLADTRSGGGDGAYDYAGLAVIGDFVLLGDRSYAAPALRVFDRATGTEVGSLRPERLPPLSLAPLR